MVAGGKVDGQGMMMMGLQKDDIISRQDDFTQIPDQRSLILKALAIDLLQTS